MTIRFMFRLTATIFVFLSIHESLSADPGDPIAVRRDADSFVIESMWNLSVRVPDVAKDFEKYGTTDRTLDRPAGTDSPIWSETNELSNPTSNAIRVRAHGSTVVVDVDGVRFTYVENSETPDDLSLELSKDTDVLMVAAKNSAAIESAAMDSAAMDSAAMDSATIQKIGAGIVTFASDDPNQPNSFAVRSTNQSPTTQRTISLSPQAKRLSAELQQLIDAKEKACRSSQDVFRKLSVGQMNFRPSNGSHTPRWNAEHMMGRELLFFSQIFAAQDPAIPIIDLNPKQMPPDYAARHADWTGNEEALQMERVTAFTRRYSYLLSELPLDAKPPGSRWTLRGLLTQMDRHYSEHTANVEKKFSLDDWPRE